MLDIYWIRLEWQFWSCMLALNLPLWMRVSTIFKPFHEKCWGRFDQARSDVFSSSNLQVGTPRNAILEPKLMTPHSLQSLGRNKRRSSSSLPAPSYQKMHSRRSREIQRLSWIVLNNCLARMQPSKKIKEKQPQTMSPNLNPSAQMVDATEATNEKCAEAKRKRKTDFSRPKLSHQHQQVCFLSQVACSVSWRGVFIKTATFDLLARKKHLANDRLGCYIAAQSLLEMPPYIRQPSSRPSSDFLT